MKRATTWHNYTHVDTKLNEEGIEHHKEAYAFHGSRVSSITIQTTTFSPRYLIIHTVGTTNRSSLTIRKEKKVNHRSVWGPPPFSYCRPWTGQTHTTLISRFSEHSNISPPFSFTLCGWSFFLRIAVGRPPAGSIYNPYISFIFPPPHFCSSVSVQNSIRKEKKNVECVYIRTVERGRTKEGEKRGAMECEMRKRNRDSCCLFPRLNHRY